MTVELSVLVGEGWQDNVIPPDQLQALSLELSQGEGPAPKSCIFEAWLSEAGGG